MKRLCHAVVLSALFAGIAFAQSAKPDFHKEALDESCRPIRPGIPGQRPFWNGHARQFIYAPAFDVAPVAEAKEYKFTAQHLSDGKSFSFTAKEPWAALSPIWKELPVGRVRLKIEALDQDGAPIKTVLECGFYRAAVFTGNYPKPTIDYKTSADLALKTLLKSPEVQCWLKSSKPDPQYKLYQFPSKLNAAVMTATAMYLKRHPNAPDREEMLTIGTHAADFLLSISEPAGRPLEFFPPTYHGMKDARHMSTDNVMVPYAAEAGLAYLDLFDVTKNNAYFDAAIKIANTYQKTQMPNGTWYQLVERQTGKPVAENLSVPTMIIRFLTRLKDDYKNTDYQPMANKAYRFIETTTLSTFDWQGQFEDVTPVKPYENLNKHESCDVAMRLLNSAAPTAEAIRLAEELIAFSEDQFVVWAQPFPTQPNSKKNHLNDSRNWITPCSLEQYKCYQPVTGSSAKMMHAYLAAFRATKRPIYLAKAEAMADAVIIQQQAGDGRYESWLRKGAGRRWMNCEVNVIRAMNELQQVKDRLAR